MCGLRTDSPFLTSGEPLRMFTPTVHKTACIYSSRIRLLSLRQTDFKRSVITDVTYKARSPHAALVCLSVAADSVDKDRVCTVYLIGLYPALGLSHPENVRPPAPLELHRPRSVAMVVHTRMSPGREVLR